MIGIYKSPHSAFHVTQEKHRKICCWIFFFFLVSSFFFSGRNLFFWSERERENYRERERERERELRVERWHSLASHCHDGQVEKKQKRVWKICGWDGCFVVSESHFSFWGYFSFSCFFSQFSHFLPPHNT